MTSFRGRSVNTRFTGRHALFKQSTYLPLNPAPEHPQVQIHGNAAYQTLSFENEEVLEKPSYVNIREVFQMDWRDAQPYWGADITARKLWRIDQPSLVRLISIVTATTKAMNVEIHPIRCRLESFDHANFLSLTGESSAPSSR